MASLLVEADLHNLVDGRVEADRRAGLLRRLASSQADRALVEAWQEQTESIRSAFGDIEGEPLPAALNLSPPRLRCVDNAALQPLAPIRTGGTRRRGFASAATAVVIMVGLAASWLAIGQSASSRGVGGQAAAPSNPMQSDVTALADRAIGALDGPAPTVPATPLPSIRLPDLSSSGLQLTDIETGESGTMVLRYRDGGHGRVAIGVSRERPDAGSLTPIMLGKAVAWRRGGAAYAMAGTLSPERLEAIAASLQDDPGSE